MRYGHYRGVRFVAAGKPTPPGFTRCGNCGRSWDDSKPTALTPAPAGRCPFEYMHKAPPAPRKRAAAGIGAPWKRDGDYVRAVNGDILAEAWPCQLTAKRRSALNLMAAAPMMREALQKIARADNGGRGTGRAGFRFAVDEARAALAASRPHPAVPHGPCDICGHYGTDCTGAP